MIHEQLRAPVEELREGFGSVLGLEGVLLLDRYPRKLSALGGELVIAMREFLLTLEQGIALGLPLLSGSDLVISHGCLLVSHRGREPGNRRGRDDDHYSKSDDRERHQ